MYDQSFSQGDVRAAMSSLKMLGIAKIELHFSGGNDEGQVDSADFFDAEGNKVEGPKDPNAYEEREWDSATRTYGPSAWTVYCGPTWRDRRPATEEEIATAKLHAILASPIYNEYGSFAGEFYVDGTCTWDVAAGTSEMHGQYESRSWESF